MNIKTSFYSPAIDGDGMVCSLTFIDGQVHFQSKYVLSKHRLEENAKKKFLYAGQMGTRNKRLLGDSLKALSSMVTGKSLNLQLRNPSNTNVFYWGGKVDSLHLCFLFKIFA